eukprot:jgi/Psemu1/328688/estExt_fgenesh1_pg.C_19450001
MATISLPDGSQQVADQTRSGSSQQQLFVHRMRKGCSSIDIWLQNASHGIQNHVVWKTLIVLFIIVLLFGPPCQIWFLPVAADVAMNTLYFTGFVIFAVDMIFHCYLDPTYFRLVSCNRRDERNKATAYADQGPCFLGSVGSFMFWCDFASTICFLLEIDLIYKRRFESITYTIPLNRFGFPDPAAFAGPIMTLVVNPIERALKLLNMLVMDPLGYQNSLQYKNFLTEPDKIAESGLWSKDVLKGMETEFLMSTIVRIGSLMKVGFGSAGVKIIRNNLQKDGNTGAVILSSQGSRVSCIFMFCDIRSFTDATECLQEEVFVFTNQIAAVVHSICNSYSGSTNKNIGDAFLVSWKLDDGPTGTKKFGNAKAKRYQADKALLSVVKISIALHHNDFYVELLSNHAKKALMDKFKDRPGPIVQLGFGLHAGKAIEGAIGSQRKIDATYVSMAVETAEYLETSTKKYNVNMLMSCSFHRLLRASRRQRCRKIDRIMFQDDDDDDEDDEFREEVVSSRGKVMELFTYDIDVNALFDHAESDDDNDEDNDEEEPIDTPFDDQLFGSFRRLSTSAKRGSKRSLRASRSTKGEPPKQEQEPKTKANTPELVLPTGPALYSENIWLQEDLRRMRRRYTTKFFDTYNLGLKKYYSEDWDEARAHFEANLNQFEDGPSRYFLNEITKYDGTPPENFKPYGRG